MAGPWSHTNLVSRFALNYSEATCNRVGDSETRDGISWKHHAWLHFLFPMIPVIRLPGNFSFSTCLRHFQASPERQERGNRYGVQPPTCGFLNQLDVIPRFLPQAAPRTMKTFLTAAFPSGDTSPCSFTLWDRMTQRAQSQLYVVAVVFAAVVVLVYFGGGPNP